MLSFANITLLLHVLVCSFLGGVESHGYLESPRARNYIAWADGVNSGSANDKYPKDHDPHSLNKGGTLAQCGTNGAKTYDYPLSVSGNLMPADPQVQYAKGQEIEVDILLTAHHKGHFEFSACPIQHGDIPTGECFKQYPLEFVSDPLYGAPKDVNFPNRAYIAPASILLKETVGLSGTFFRFRLKLPNSLSGDLVLLQWHYLTANSCQYDGYSSYSFPAAWGNMVGVGICQTISPDGSGLPEQFWNCAEIAITDGPVAPSTPAPIPAPSPPTVPQPTEPYSSDTNQNSCGDGKRGNGVCASNIFACCSKWGFCGTTPAHCTATTQRTPTIPAPSMTALTPHTLLAPIQLVDPNSVNGATGTTVSGNSCWNGVLFAVAAQLVTTICLILLS